MFPWFFSGLFLLLLPFSRETILSMYLGSVCLLKYDIYFNWLRKGIVIAKNVASLKWCLIIHVRFTFKALHLRFSVEMSHFEVAWAWFWNVCLYIVVGFQVWRKKIFLICTFSQKSCARIYLKTIWKSSPFCRTSTFVKILVIYFLPVFNFMFPLLVPLCCLLKLFCLLMWRSTFVTYRFQI